MQREKDQTSFETGEQLASQEQVGKHIPSIGIFLNDPRNAETPLYIIDPETGKTFRLKIEVNSINYTDGLNSRLLVPPIRRQSRNGIRTPLEYLLTQESINAINRYLTVIKGERDEIRKHTAMACHRTTARPLGKPILRKRTENILSDPMVVRQLDQFEYFFKKISKKPLRPQKQEDIMILFYGHRQVGEILESLFEYAGKHLGIEVTDDEKQSFCYGGNGSNVVQLIRELGSRTGLATSTKAFLDKYLRGNKKVYLRIYRSMNKDGSFNNIDSCEVMGIE